MKHNNFYAVLSRGFMMAVLFSAPAWLHIHSAAAEETRWELTEPSSGMITAIPGRDGCVQIRSLSLQCNSATRIFDATGKPLKINELHVNDWVTFIVSDTNGERELVELRVMARDEESVPPEVSGEEQNEAVSVSPDTPEATDETSNINSSPVYKDGSVWKN